MVLPLDNGVPVPASLPPAIHHIPPSAGTRSRNPSGAGAGVGSVRAGGRGGGGGGGGGDYTPATYLDNPPPAYPLAARLAGHTGIVLLEVIVNDSGHPTAVTVARSSGDPVLDRAAVTAVRRWRFHPALAAGRPVTARVEFPVRFRLK